MGLFRKLKALRGDEAAEGSPTNPSRGGELEWLPPHAPLASPSPTPTVPPPTPTVPPASTAPATPAATSVPAPPAPVAAPAAAIVPAAAPAKPAPGTIPPALLKDLADKIGKLSKSTQAEQEAVKGFTDKVAKMEERVEKFQMLFEALSVKYNPFLGKDDPEVFDGIQPDRVAKGAAPHGASRLREGAEIVSTDGPMPTNGNGHHGSGHNGNGHHAAPDPAPSAPLAPHPATPIPPPAPVHASPSSPLRVHVPPALGSRGASGGPRQAPWGGAAVQGTRESYLVLSWFEHMLETVEPAQIYRFLDYYLELGWITPEVHDWFVHLAVSVAPTSEEANAEAAGRKPSPLELVRLHKTSLQFFDYLFRINLNPGEGRHLERVVDSLVDREGRVMRRVARRANAAAKPPKSKVSKPLARRAAEAGVPATDGQGNGVSKGEPGRGL